jgi:hypothetical protein
MWLGSDRAAALEWQAEDDLKCGGCGKPRDETMVSDEFVEAGLAPDYVADMWRCRACEATGAKKKAVEEEGGEMGSGLYFIPREVRLNGQEVS